MSGLPGEPSKQLETQARVYELIGHISSDWATLEHFINESIWALADVEPAYGACMTAQIYTIEGRFRALLALLKKRRADTHTIALVNKFAESARGPNDKRNRIIHDPWGFGILTGSTFRIEITAARKLVFQLRRVDIAELEKDQEAIHDCVDKFVDIRDRILAEIPSLPEIPLTERRPIIEGPRRMT